MADNITSINHTGEDYSTIAAWESDTDNNLVSTTTREILEVYADDGALTDDYALVSGATTDASYYRWIRARSADQHSGVWASGNATIDHTTTSKHIIRIGEAYGQVSGLQLRANTGDRCLYLTGNNNKAFNNIIDGYGDASTGSVIVTAGTNTLIYRNIIYDVGLEGVVVNYAGTTAYVYANTIINCARGIRRLSTSTVYAKNNICLDNTSADFDGTFDASSDYNIGSDTSAPGSNSLDSRSLTDSTSPGAGDWVIVTETAAGSEDYTLYDNSTDNDAIDAGDNLGSPYDVDITGYTVTGTWDVGAFEVQAAGGTDITLVTGSIAIDGEVVTVQSSSDISLVSGSVATDGEVVTVQVDPAIALGEGSIATDGEVVTVQAESAVDLVTGSVAIDGEVVTVQADSQIDLVTGAIAIDGEVVTVDSGSSVTITVPTESMDTFDRIVTLGVTIPVPTDSLDLFPKIITLGGLNQPLTGSIDIFPQSLTLSAEISGIPQVIWIENGNSSASFNSSETPGGITGAYNLSSIGVLGIGDIYDLTTGYAASEELTTVFYLKPVSSSGTLMVTNPSDQDRGFWSIDLADLTSSYQLITQGHSAVNIIYPFYADTSGTAGLQFSSFHNDLELYVSYQRGGAVADIIAGTVDISPQVLTLQAETEVDLLDGSLQIDEQVPTVVGSVEESVSLQTGSVQITENIPTVGTGTDVSVSLVAGSVQISTLPPTVGEDFYIGISLLAGSAQISSDALSVSDGDAVSVEILTESVYLHPRVPTLNIYIEDSESVELLPGSLVLTGQEPSVFVYSNWTKLDDPGGSSWTKLEDFSYL